MQTGTLLEYGTAKYSIWENMRKNISDEGLNQNEIDTLFSYVLNYDFLTNKSTEFIDLLSNELSSQLQEEVSQKAAVNKQKKETQQNTSILEHKKRIDELINQSNKDIDAYYVNMKRPNFQYEVVSFREKDELFIKERPEEYIKSYLNEMAALGWHLVAAYSKEDYKIDTINITKIRDRIRTFNEITIILEREIPEILR